MVDYSAYHWAKKAQYWAESIGSALIYRGSVATYADLPSSDQKVGDMYNVLADGSNYAWDGTAWDALSGIVDLSAYRTSADQDLIDAGKQPSLTTGTGINISSSNVISVTSPTLTNVSTGNSSLSVLGAATVDSSATSIGVDSTAGTNGSSLGRSAKSVNGGLAIGTYSKANGTWSTALGDGNSESNSATATSSDAIAIGHDAHATASSAYQIGVGTNSTANSLQVKTYKLLDTSTGKIPDDRLSTNIAKTSDIKDATITITQGGVTKGSFTLNQSTGDTIDLDAGGGGSYSAGTGIDITGSTISVTSPTLTNNSTYSTSLSIMGSAISAYSQAVSVGSSSVVYGDYGTSIGGASSSVSNATAVGHIASATGSYSSAFGKNAKSTANYAIQIGTGTNSEANSMYVATSSSDNWKMLGSDGIIPIGRILVSKQDPTSANDYTWYRLYSDGWVEQGGIKTAITYGGAAFDQTVTLPKAMSDINYLILANPYRQDNFASYAGFYTGVSTYCTTTTVRLYTTGVNASQYIHGVKWYVAGYAVTS